MQGASWFSQNHQRQRNPQFEELARTLARQVTLNVAPSMRNETPDEKRIGQVLRLLTGNSRILDAGVYDEQGNLIARAGEHVDAAEGGARNRGPRPVQPGGRAVVRGGGDAVAGGTGW